MAVHPGVESPGIGPVAVIVIFLVASLVLAALGKLLARRGFLASRGAALGWAVLSVLPLFVGVGWLMMDRQSRSSISPPGPGAPEQSGDLNRLQ